MKAVNIIIKILAALAAIAGVVYVIAAYGDKIVAWAKKLLGRTACYEHVCEDDFVEEATEEAPLSEDELTAEEPDADEAPVAEEAAEDAVVASDADFEG